MFTNRRNRFLMSSALALGIMAQAAIAQDSVIDGVTPVTDEMLLNPPDGDWLMWRRTYNWLGLQPARPDQQGQCGRSEAGVVLGDDAGAHAGNATCS